MRRLIIGVSLLLAGAAQAAAIDFDSESIGSISSPLVIGDFSFFAAGAEIIEQSPGDNALFLEAFGPTTEFGDAGPLIISMGSTSGDPFAFFGADVLGTSEVGIASFGPVGIISGGGFAAGPVGTGDWLNLEAVQFSVSSSEAIFMFDTLSITVDNVNANVVPIPAAVWLFGSALAGLGWLKRKQTS